MNIKEYVPTIWALSKKNEAIKDISEKITNTILLMVNALASDDIELYRELKAELKEQEDEMNFAIKLIGD